MERKICIYTLQWSDQPLEQVLKLMSEIGYDGIELGCRGDHFDPVKALESDKYVQGKKELLEKYNLKCFAISEHLTSACVCDDPIDHRHKAIVPKRVWGDGDPEGVRQRAAEEMMNVARAAKLMDVQVVPGLSGSRIWAKFYPFPPIRQEEIDEGYADFGRRWTPILDVFKENNVRYALEAHGTQIAYDIITGHRALEAVNHHPAMGFNLDPSHLVNQFVNPVYFIEEHGQRIFHVHAKDVRLNLTGRNSILNSHLYFGDPRRGWEFMNPGRGDVKWDPMFRALDRAGYQGPISVEWEDPNVERNYGAGEAFQFVKKTMFPSSDRLADDAWAE